MLLVRHAKLVAKGVVIVGEFKAREYDLDLLVKWLSRSCPKVVVNRVACAFSNSTKRILPDKLLRHAYNDCCF